MRFLLTIFCLAFLCASMPSVADDDAVIVARGDADLTLFDLDARVSRIPDSERIRLGEQHQTLANMMSRLLINRQLANEARELGLDKDHMVRRDLELAAEEVLATHRMNALVTIDSMPDFELLAHERYLADPQQHTVPRTINVRHILISVDDGDSTNAGAAEGEDEDKEPGLDDGAALAKANEVLALARQPDTDFTALIKMRVKPRTSSAGKDSANRASGSC